MPPAPRLTYPGLKRVMPIVVGLMAIALTAVALSMISQKPSDAGPTPSVTVTSTNPGTSTPPDSGATCGTGTNAVTVSHPSGFYDGPFSLSMSSASEEEIFYTLDGTRPELGPLGSSFDSGRLLRLEDRSSEPGPLTAIRTSVYMQPHDLDSGGGAWDIAGPSMDRGIPLRVRTETGIECTFVYFIGANLAREIPVVHLSLNPQFLFDHNTGIYVLGAYFDARRSEYDPNRAWRTFGNYSQRGREWERPFADDPEDSVVMHYFTDDGAFAYSTNLGIRIHGGISRTYPQKSLRLYARNEYGSGSFHYPFFGAERPQVHRRLILRGAGNDCLCVPNYGGLAGSHLADGYLQTVVADFAIDSQAMSPVALFINGEYWGIHNLRDRHDEHYIEVVHGVDSDSVAVIEGPPPNSATAPEDWRPLLDLLDYLEGTSPTDDSAIARLEAELDLESFFDWMSVQVFVANQDVYNNYRLWRVRTEPVGGPRRADDGRWRWFLHDLDMYDWARTGDGSFDMFAEIHQSEAGEIPYRLYRWLLRHNDFRSRWLNRLGDHLNSTYLPERTVPILDGLETLLAPEMEEHIARWTAAAGHSIEGWHVAVDHMRRFMTDRPDHLWRQIVSHFGLGGTSLIRVLSDEGGTVRINGLTLAGDTPGVADPADWTGMYFTGIPIQLAAIAQPGFRFAGWDGVPAALADQPNISLELSSSLQVSARFITGG